MPAMMLNHDPPFARKNIPTKMVVIERPFYNQNTFDEVYSRQQDSRTVKETVKKALSKCSCTAKLVKSFILTIFPFIRIMSEYSPKSDLPNDIISGLTVGIMNIPQGMAYALLAEIPPIYGLYTSLWPVLIYFFFGTSRHISIGTFAVVSIMVGSSVSSNMNSHCAAYIGGSTTEPSTPVTTTVPVLNTVTMVTGNTTTGAPEAGISDQDKCKFEIAATVTLLVGLIQFGMGIFHLGFLTQYFSTPLTRGFTTGCAMHVFTSQIKYVFGLEPQRYNGAFKLIYTYIDLFRKILNTQVAAIIISAVCMTILIITKEFINPKVKAKIKIPVPIELIVVIAGTIASHFGNFNERWNIRNVGFIPRGIPAPTVPPADLYSTVIVDAVVIAVVSYAVSVSMAKLFADKHNYDVDSTSELLAYGIMNTAGSFLNCFVASVSLSRSLVQDSAGGRTQLAGVLSCVLVLVVVLAIGPLFEQLPNAVLASIILVALKGMFLQFQDLKHYWKVNKYDFACWLVVFLATAILDVDLGLVVGVGFSFITVIIRTQRPRTCKLGRLPTTDIYKDVKEYNKASEIEGVKIYRFESALFYMNKDRFLEDLAVKSGVDPKKLRQEQLKVEKFFKKSPNEEGTERNLSASVNNMVVPKPVLHHIIIDCSNISFLDAVGVLAISRAISQYDAVGIKVYLASCTGGVYNMLESGGLFDTSKRDIIFLTVHEAVLAALEDYPDLLHKLQNNVSITSSKDTIQEPEVDLTDIQVTKL